MRTVNFDDEWKLNVKKYLTSEKDLWSDIEIFEGDLYVDSISITHIDEYNILSLLCWLQVSQAVSDNNLYEFCNQEKHIFQKIYLDGVTEAFDKKSICLDLRIPTHGGISVEALQKTVELFWLDMVRIESKLSENGWLEE